MSHAPSPEDVAEYKRIAARGQIATKANRAFAEEHTALLALHAFDIANLTPRKAAHDAPVHPGLATR